MNNKYAVFIISHKRPDNVITLSTILNAGYNGKWFIVLDNLDDTIPLYIKNFGKEHIIIFDKYYYVDKTDYALSAPKLSSAVFARNAVEDIARKLNLSAYICLDDDIRNFIYRYEDDGKLRGKVIKSNITAIFNGIVNFILDNNVSCASCSYQQLYMLGCTLLKKENAKTRLCIEAFFRNLKFNVNWMGNIAEDYLTSIKYGRLGQIFMQLPFLQVDMPTACLGIQAGGNSTLYRNTDRCEQLFFLTLYYPDAFKLYVRQGELYNSPVLNNLVPKIIEVNKFE